MLEIALRLAAALFAGAAIGLNRDLRGKPAGVKTHALVTLGAAVSVLVVVQMGSDHVDAVSRVVQGIVAGVGFLGAGVILRHASGQVSGLTTAATIWVCAALGTVCGLGDWDLLLVSLALVLAILLVGEYVERTAERFFGRAGPPDGGP